MKITLETRDGYLMLKGEIDFFKSNIVYFTSNSKAYAPGGVSRRLGLSLDEYRRIVIED